MQEANYNNSGELFDWLEHDRALVGVYVDHLYTKEKLDWVLEAREGFDAHVGDAFHLLIPHNAANKRSGGFDREHAFLAKGYGTGPARNLITKLEISHGDLPCIVFRAQRSNYYFCKLGGRTKLDFLSILGAIGDLALECARDGSDDVATFKTYVNTCTMNYLRKERMFSGLRRSLPIFNAMLGGAVDVKELV